jgi:NhaP-type Na+/H+ or K+/H+ antiporter
VEKGTVSPALAGIIGAAVGLVLGCLITWFPIRLLFCSVYNTPDCEEIVLITFPFYCIIAPLIGGAVAYMLYRRRREQK